MGERRVTADGRILEKQADGSIIQVGGPQQGDVTATPLPRNPYEERRDQIQDTGRNLDNQGQGITNQVNAGTARTTIQTNQAPEGTMWRDPNNPSAGVVRIPGYEEKRVTPELRSAALQGFKDAESIAATVEMLRKQYYAGPGSTKGIYGLGDYLPTDANASFDDTGQRARGYVKGALGFTGGEGNTAMEADATYGPYLPTAGDRDGQIANKIAALEALGIKAREKAIATLGGIPDQYGNIQPIPEGERANAMTYLRTDGGANNQTEAAGFNATQKAVPYPEAGQSMHDQLVGRLIAEGDGRLDPQAYAKARMALDRQQGVEPGDPASYAAWAESINTYLGEGGTTIPTGIEPSMQDMTYGETVRNRAASMPEGALFAGYLNSAGFGVPEMMTGANMDMMRSENPIPALTGEIGGVITGTGVLGKLGREGAERTGINLSDEAMSRFGRNLGTDATYGGIYGGTTEGRPVMGATLGAAGSIGGQAVGKTAETAIGGVRLSAPAQALRDRGVRLTSGRIFGDTASRIEDKMVSLPFAGDMVRRRQTEGMEDFTRAMLDEVGSPTGFRPTAIGREGVEQVRGAKNQAYTDAVSGVQVPGDRQFLDDIAATEQMTETLPFDLQQRSAKLLGNHTNGITPPLTKQGENKGWTNWSYRAADGREIPVDTYPIGNSVEISVDPMSVGNANAFGIPEMRRALPELKREFPDAESVFGKRISGANPGRVQEVSLGGVQPAPFGALTGEQYQRAMIGLKTARSKADTVAGEFAQPYRDMTTSGMDAFRGLMQRGGGDDVVTNLAKADELNKNFKIAEDAIIKRARNGTRSGEVGLPAPSQWVDAAAASESKYGPNSLRQLAEDGQRVLPSSVPNSGTADRLALGGLALAGVGGGGTEYMTQQNLDTTATGLGGTAAFLTALTLLGSRKGQKAIETIALDRPDALKKVASSLRGGRRLFGAAGVPLALSAQ